MKKIIILSVLVLMTACYNIQFDSLEYDRYITIKEIADNAIQQCGTPVVIYDISNIKTSMDHQYLYSVNREARPQVASAAASLKELVDGLYNRYASSSEPPSIAYCQEKFKNISLGATTVVRTLGRL